MIANKLFFLVFSIVCIPTFVWTQKGGSFVNLSRSPARQIQTNIVQSNFAPTASLATQLQSSSQQYQDDLQAALAANLRIKPASETLDSGLEPARDDGSENHPAPEPYAFSYSVEDEENGSETSREESQDAQGNVVGFYQIRDNEGRLRRVEYTAGPEGFRATIRSNEEGLANSEAADAKYEVDEVPAERQEQAAAAARLRASADGGGNSFNNHDFTATVSAIPSFALAAGQRMKSYEQQNGPAQFQSSLPRTTIVNTSRSSQRQNGNVLVSALSTPSTVPVSQVQLEMTSLFPLSKPSFSTQIPNRANRPSSSSASLGQSVTQSFEQIFEQQKNENAGNLDETTFSGSGAALGLNNERPKPQSSTSTNQQVQQLQTQVPGQETTQQQQQEEYEQQKLVN